MKIVITGTGVVSPVGIGCDGFWTSLVQGRTGIGEIEGFSRRGRFGGEVRGFDFKRLFDARGFRRAADVTKYALVSAKEALTEAGIDRHGIIDDSRIGVVTGVTHGALGYSCEFHRGFSTEGPLGASPALFSDSVLNAATGSVSLAFGLKGPSHTLVGGPSVGLQAVSLGAELLRSGMLDACIVLASETLSEVAFEAYSSLGMISRSMGSAAFTGARGFLLGEGAGAVVLEGSEGALSRGAVPRAEVAGWACRSGAGLKDAVADGLERALSMAGLDGRGVAGAIVGANGCGIDRAEGAALGGLLSEGVPVTSLKPFIGEGFGAASMMSVVAAVLSLGKRTMLPNAGFGPVLPEWSWARLSTEPQEAALENILVSSTGFLEEAGSVILKKVR